MLLAKIRWSHGDRHSARVSVATPAALSSVNTPASALASTAARNMAGTRLRCMWCSAVQNNGRTTSKLRANVNVRAKKSSKVVGTVPKLLLRIRVFRLSPLAPHPISLDEHSQRQSSKQATRCTYKNSHARVRAQAMRSPKMFRGFHIKKKGEFLLKFNHNIRHGVRSSIIDVPAPVIGP